MLSKNLKFKHIKKSGKNVKNLEWILSLELILNFSMIFVRGNGRF